MHTLSGTLNITPTIGYYFISYLRMTSFLSPLISCFTLVISRVQVDTSKATRDQLPLSDNMDGVVILVRCVDTKRRVFHTTVTLVALSLVVYRVIQWFKQL